MKLDEFRATKQPVKNRGTPPDEFLLNLVDWASTAHDGLFQQNANRDVYSVIVPILGNANVPAWSDLLHRKAALLETLRVLAGFESSWNPNEGVDKSAQDRSAPETQEAGLWQVSMDAINYGEDLRLLVRAKLGTSGFSAAKKFQATIKRDFAFNAEFTVRVLRHTVNHNGPVKRGEILPWLKRDAVDEFRQLLS